jgi:putative methionine-R-sulfoxide reductase with GAF domain
MQDPNVTDHTAIQIAPASADPVEITRLSGCTSHICVFMRDEKGETLGLLSVQSISQRTFSRNDSALLNALADIVAVRFSQRRDMVEKS